MNSNLIRTVAKQVGLWWVLVVVTALLTLLFTVLGTITCAVLTGVMMGSIRHRRWQTIPVSLVFPAVVMVMVHFAKVELIGRQPTLLPLLCLAAFWTIYLLTCILQGLEAKAESAPAVNSDGKTPDKATPEHPAPADSSLNVPAELQLEAIQGRWVCKPPGLNGAPQQKLMEIAGNNLSLSVIDCDGRTRLVAQGNMRLDRSRPAPGSSSDAV